MANFTPLECNKMKIDESFQAYKRDDLKAIYKTKFNDEKAYEERCTINKILKLDENN